MRCNTHCTAWAQHQGAVDSSQRVRKTQGSAGYPRGKPWKHLSWHGMLYTPLRLLRLNPAASAPPRTIRSEAGLKAAMPTTDLPRARSPDSVNAQAIPPAPPTGTTHTAAPNRTRRHRWPTPMHPKLVPPILTAPPSPRTSRPCAPSPHTSCSPCRMAPRPRCSTRAPEPASSRAHPAVFQTSPPAHIAQQAVHYTPRSGDPEPEHHSTFRGATALPRTPRALPRKTGRQLPRQWPGTRAASRQLLWRRGARG